MAKIMLEVNLCDICGHTWIPKANAIQCASSKCRSRAWDSDSMSTANIYRQPLTHFTEPQKKPDELRPEYWRPVALPSKMERTVECEE